MEASSLLVNLRKGMQGSSEQPLVGDDPNNGCEGDYKIGGLACSRIFLHKKFF